MSAVRSELDVVLIFPRTGADFDTAVAPPHSLLAIAAPVEKAGFKVEIIDQRIDPNWELHLKQAISAKPLCVGISSMTGPQVLHGLKAAKVVRTNGDQIPIVWGGPHPSTLPEQTLQHELVDIVCVGEGDQTFLELVQHLAAHRPLHGVAGIAFKNGSRITLTATRPLLDVEQLLPVPWHLVNVEKYIHLEMYLGHSPRTLDIGQTSRGCPFNCTFCSSASLRRRYWRAMSAVRALQAIREPVKRFGLTGIRIRDDEFYIDRHRVNQICEGMIGEKLGVKWYSSGTRIDLFNRATDGEIQMLKRSGAGGLKFGAESGSERILQLMGKGITPDDTREANRRCHKHGITPVYAFMVAWPSETWKEVKQTLDLVRDLCRDNPRAHIDPLSPATALPGTPLWQQALGLGLCPPETLEGWGDWTFGGYESAGRRLPWLSPQDRSRLFRLCRSFFKAYSVMHTFDGIRSPHLRFIAKSLYAPVAAWHRWRLGFDA